MYLLRYTKSMGFSITPFVMIGLQMLTIKYRSYVEPKDQEEFNILTLTPPMMGSVFNSIASRTHSGHYGSQDNTPPNSWEPAKMTSGTASHYGEMKPPRASPNTASMAPQCWLHEQEKFTHDALTGCENMC